MNDLEFIQEYAGVDEDDAASILDLCAWVDHQEAVERFGYPKDNVIPRPIAERLADPRYLRRLHAAALDEEVPERVKRALEALVEPSI